MGIFLNSIRVYRDNFIEFSNLPEYIELDMTKGRQYLKDYIGTMLNNLCKLHADSHNALYHYSFNKIYPIVIEFNRLDSYRIQLAIDKNYADKIFLNVNINGNNELMPFINLVGMWKLMKGKKELSYTIVEIFDNPFVLSIKEGTASDQNFIYLMIKFDSLSYE